MRAEDPAMLADVLCDGDTSTGAGELLTGNGPLGFGPPHRTFLMDAVACENAAEMLDVILSAGLPVHPRSFAPLSGGSDTHPGGFRSAVFHVARNPAVQELLLEMGADPDFEACTGYWVLSTPEERSETISLLLCHGANAAALCTRVSIDIHLPFCGPLRANSLDSLEWFVQAGAPEEFLARIFWDSNADYKPSVLESLLELDFVDQATRELFRGETGVQFSSLRSLADFLNDPELDLLSKTPKLAERLGQLLLLASDSARRPLVEALVIAGSSLPQFSHSAPRTPVCAGCLSRDDCSEMMSLLLCSDAVATFDCPNVARYLVASIEATGTPGPTELLMMCGLSLSAATSPFSPNNPLIVFGWLQESWLSEELLRWAEIPDQRLAGTLPFVLGRRNSLDLLLKSCRELSLMLDCSYLPATVVPLLSIVHARPSAEESSWIRLMAQCGVDLAPMLASQTHGRNPDRAPVWRDAVCHNTDCSIGNDTETIFWPVRGERHTLSSPLWS